MGEHEHRWSFTLGPNRWTATCHCGLGVTVEERAPGRSVWQWTLRGETLPADVMLDGVGSVTRARRQLPASLFPSTN